MAISREDSAPLLLDVARVLGDFSPRRREDLPERCYLFVLFLSVESYKILLMRWCMLVFC